MRSICRSVWICTMAAGLVTLLALSPITASSQSGSAKQTASSGSKQAAAQPSRKAVDLNTATPAQLEALPGVSAAMAKKILDGRPYSSVSDLARVGVPKTTIQALAGQVEAKSPELIKNASFESLQTGWPNSWWHSGSPTVDSSGTQSHTGRVAVRCAGADSVFGQAIPVEPRGTYVLGYYARAPQAGQTARLQVNWTDGKKDSLLQYDIRIVSVTEKWKHYSMSVVAPDSAAHGVIYASAQGHSRVWFDDMSFVRGSAVPDTTR